MWSLVLVKPDLVSHPFLLKAAVNELVSAGIEIGASKVIRLTKESAIRLYGVHQGKFFFNRLVRHVTSGPVIAMRVRGDVRSLVGGSRLWPLDDSQMTMRQRLALSDVRNIVHNSDAESAARELAIFEPFDSNCSHVEDILRYGISPQPDASV